VVLDVVEALDEVEPPEEPEDEGVLATGVGETIDGVDEPADDGVVVLVAVVAVEEDGEELLGLEDAGLELSFGTPLANGSRAIRASTTLTGSAEAVVAVAVVAVVVVRALVAVTAAGAGTVGVVLAAAPLSRNAGTAAIATTRIATTIHSLRSTRSLRRAFILVLRSSSRPSQRAGRWWR
jgi:hypothetical protein